MLVAKLFTKRALNIEVVARTLRPLWKTKHEFRIKDLGNYLILFTFKDELDAKKTLLRAPWFRLLCVNTKPISLSKSFVLTRQFFGFKYMIFQHGE